MNHLDDGAIAALTGFYRTVLPASGDVLDLMSSWVSHLPADLPLGTVIGHGMNEVELAANPRLSRWFIQDLNLDPTLPLRSGIIDTALCCVGVQYLERPIEVLTEVARVLRPGSVVIVSFSNRCFPTKAVAIWRESNMAAQARLIARYLVAAGFDTAHIRVLADGSRSDPLIAVVGRTGLAVAA